MAKKKDVGTEKISLGMIRLLSFLGTFNGCEVKIVEGFRCTEVQWKKKTKRYGEQEAEFFIYPITNRTESDRVIGIAQVKIDVIFGK